jgi:hypothetical protein
MDDMFNPPTAAQLGQVALTSSKRDINWYAGSELGDHLEWNGSIWVKRNGWITPTWMRLARSTVLRHYLHYFQSSSLEVVYISRLVGIGWIARLR